MCSLLSAPADSITSGTDQSTASILSSCLFMSYSGALGLQMLENEAFRMKPWTQWHQSATEKQPCTFYCLQKQWQLKTHALQQGKWGQGISKCAVRLGQCCWWNYMDLFLPWQCLKEYRTIHHQQDATDILCSKSATHTNTYSLDSLGYHALS